MAHTVKPPLMTRLLEELEVHGTTVGELYLILLALHGVARALTVLFSAGHGPGF